MDFKGKGAVNTAKARAVIENGRIESSLLFRDSERRSRHIVPASRERSGESVVFSHTDCNSCANSSINVPHPPPPPSGDPQSLF